MTTERIVPRHRHRLRVPRLLRRLIGVVAVIAIWQLLSSTGRLPQTIVGSPVDVWDQGVTLAGNGELGSAISASAAGPVAAATTARGRSRQA